MLTCDFYLQYQYTIISTDEIKARVQLLLNGHFGDRGQASGRKWTKSDTVIGYWAGKMALSYMLRITCSVPQGNSVLFPYNK